MGRACPATADCISNHRVLYIKRLNSVLCVGGSQRPTTNEEVGKYLDANKEDNCPPTQNVAALATITVQQNQRGLTVDGTGIQK